MPHRQVSHFVVESLVTVADHAGLSLEELCEGLPVSAGDLRRRMDGLPWDVLVEFIERIEARVGADRLRELSTQVTQLAPIARAALRRLVRPRHMLRFVFRVLGPTMYPMYTVALDEKDLPDGSTEVHVELRLREGFRECATLFSLHGVATAHIPVTYGDPPLPVRTEHTSRGGDYWFTVR